MLNTNHIVSNSYLHDAFISYSRRDKPFAILLERTLRRYIPPAGVPLPRRRLDIFRDEEDFTGTEYFQAVQRHLQGSRKLIVICSPNARASAFVNDEIRRFTQIHPTSDLIPVIIAGSPETTNVHGEADLAFPRALCELLEMPLASDYRGFDPKSSNLRSGRYRTAWYKLLADLCNCTRAEIEKREARRRFRQRVQWGSGITAVAASLTVIAYIAQQERHLALSNDLANQALSIAESDPARGTSLALEAIGRRNTPFAIGALRAALANLPDLQIAVAPDAGIYAPIDVAFASDEHRIALTDKQAGVRVLDAQTGQTVLELAHTGDVPVSPEFSPDNTMLAIRDASQNSTVYETATGSRIASLQGELHWLHPAASTGPTVSVLGDQAVQLVEIRPSGLPRIVSQTRPEGYSRPKWGRGPAISPDGRRLAIGRNNGAKAQLSIIDLDSGRTMSGTGDGDFASFGLAWSPQGTYVASKWLMGFAVFNTHSLRDPFVKDTGNEISVEDVAFSPDEKLFASTDRSGLTTLWNIQQRKTVGRFQGPSERAYVPVFSPDSKLMSVVYSNGKGTLFSLDAIDERFIRTAEPAAMIDSVWGEVVAIRFSPSGSQLIIRYAGGKLAFWDTGRWLPQYRLPMHFDPRYRGGRPQGLADISVAADGSVVGIESAGQWRGWNTESGSEVAQKTETMLPFTEASPSKMGERSLRIIGQEANLLDRKLGRTLRLAHNDDVTSAAFSPDGSCVVTTSGVKRASGGPREGGDVARLWDAETGALLREWWFPDPPDAAFFAGVQRVVVLHGGQALVYRTPLCQAGEPLVELARDRATINTASTLTSPPTPLREPPPPPPPPPPPLR